MAIDESGWMPGIERVPFREFAHSGIPEDGMYPKAIVHHVMQGYFAGARAMALNSIVGEAPSWHFSIARDGRIMQHVSIWDTAWHCGIPSSTIPQPLVQRFRQEFGRDTNSWTIGVEHEGFSIPAFVNGKRVDDYVYSDAEPWPEAMIQASIRVQKWIWNSCQWLIDLSPEEHSLRFLQHSQIDPITRPQDPGEFWDRTVWHRIVNGVFAVPAPPRVEPPMGLSAGAREAFEAIGGWSAAVLDGREEWPRGIEQIRLWADEAERRARI